MEKKIKTPWKAVRKVLSNRRRDLLLFYTLPKAYRAHVKEPVQNNKVIFVEARLDHLDNSFAWIYKVLKENYNVDIHVHYLRETFVPYREYVRNCRRMLADAATARYIFLTEASNVIGCIPKRKETTVCQLWHACGAFKKFGLSTAGELFGPDLASHRRHPYYGNLDLVTVSSPEVIWAYAEAMDLKGREEIIKPLGTSRTDVFFRDDFISAARERLYQVFPAARGKKVILFAPTFRGGVSFAETARKFDPAKLAPALSDEYVIVIKHHPLIRSLPKIDPQLDGIFACDVTKSMTIEDLLCVSDICISDYSSVIFEYSLFERPMLFFAYDLEEYFDWRGFYYDYETLAPGPVCRTHEELIGNIRKLREGFDPGRVREFKERFMSACDGHSTERILKEVFGGDLVKLQKKTSYDIV